jgi:hypothetical protein
MITCPAGPSYQLVYTLQAKCYLYVIGNNKAE